MRTGALQMQLVVHPASQALRDVSRRAEQAHCTGDVDERLVETDRLDHGRDVGQDLMQLPTDLRVPVVAA